MPLTNSSSSNEFNAIRLRLASSKEILNWSNGEVLKPETINYRTQKPERDGLFCEKIFGPTKDWECYCGKYKRIRYKGIVCDKCGVEVTRSLVRRERMGHIKLAAPVSHIWFLRNVPSRIGLSLALTGQELEKIIYFANFVITKVDEQLREEQLKQLEIEFETGKKSIENEFSQKVGNVQKKEDDTECKKSVTKGDKVLIGLSKEKEEKLQKFNESFESHKKEIKKLAPLQVISEDEYAELSLKYGHIFEASIGAEAIKELLSQIDLDKEIEKLKSEYKTAVAGKQIKIIKRLNLFKNFKLNDIRPEWMVMDVVPIIPPDLRPMVQLDGGRFAASDLNDLYRRVINRNNRLKKLLELNAPEVIVRNEKRMLQEAVDSLIDNNARHGKTVTSSTGQKRMLKSVADILKGKQGRFRQNLLGKRVDYSGRSVIVVGPHLKIHQCGLPKQMALELFRPFVISKLIKRELVYNVRSANRFIESGESVIWDILEEVIKGAYVLLNRAPTLHRLGIQAFQPVLIEGKAIQVHPLVCPPFNADFDGDQMAVHVPLTDGAIDEAKNLMLSSKNLLKPATGEPSISPDKDLILGCYYLTNIDVDDVVESTFSSPEEAEIAYDHQVIRLRSKIKVRISGKILETCMGRILFNEVLPEKLRFVNDKLNSKKINVLTGDCLELYGSDRAAQLLDDIKELSLEYVTKSGISWGMSDLPTLTGKSDILKRADEEVVKIHEQYDEGLLTDDERKAKVIEVWVTAKNKVGDLIKGAVDSHSPIYSMIDSGARGSWGQIIQMVGMKGLVTNPAGQTIELPVKGNFKEGFGVLEYFISTHGARKGLTDTALRTANAGYLTRRLVDVSQDVVITEKDCKDTEGIVITAKESNALSLSLGRRAFSRVTLEDIVHPKTKKIIVAKGEYVTKDLSAEIDKSGVQEVSVRSLLTCKIRRGVCAKCYGFDLGRNRPVDLGVAVGIIAAESIGEPGTQLTMRTFHTGGVVSDQDITQGLPRVEEIFEARKVKKPALISKTDGQATVERDGRNKILKIHYRGIETLQINVKNYDHSEVKVKDGDKIKTNGIILTHDQGKVNAQFAGEIKIKKNIIEISGETDKIDEMKVSAGYTLWVNDGDLITKGQQLTEGSLNLEEVMKLRGLREAQKYILSEIQHIYTSQGQRLHDKHIEAIIRQMFSHVRIKDAGSSDILPGNVVPRSQFLEANDRIKKGKKVIGEDVLLGVTKASLSTESFLSAASFQETSRVLIDAAVTGKIDPLRGLKENVIIGRLIPAGTGFRKGNKK